MARRCEICGSTDDVQPVPDDEAFARLCARQPLRMDLEQFDTCRGCRMS